MKLDLDCVRDILLATEEMSQPFVTLTSDSYYSNQYTSKYDENTLAYHFNQLMLSDLIYPPKNCRVDLSGTYYIMDLTPQGHKFISDIRQDTNWRKVKTVAQKVGSYSLDAISQIATSVISEVINGKLTQF